MDDKLRADEIVIRIDGMPYILDTKTTTFLGGWDKGLLQVLALWKTVSGKYLQRRHFVWSIVDEQEALAALLEARQMLPLTEEGNKEFAALMEKGIVSVL